MENLPKLSTEELHDLSIQKKEQRKTISNIQETKFPQNVREKKLEKPRDILSELKEKSHGLIEAYGGISAVKEALRERQAFDVLSAHFDSDTIQNLKEHTELKDAYDTLITKQVKLSHSIGGLSPDVQRFLDECKEDVRHEEEALNTIQENNPTLARAYELLS
ncbi:MAG: hypothetical protein HZB12_01485 [Candidatus Yonathbacteria bacterium]|nr:hypothetical protein [Candidatus Yonathbacteria bacterium]